MKSIDEILSLPFVDVIERGNDGRITIHADVFNYCPMCGRHLEGSEDE